MKYPRYGQKNKNILSLINSGQSIITGGFNNGAL
jgi:hypothetical protein